MGKIGIVYLCELLEKWKSGAEGILYVLTWCMNVGLIASHYECPKCGANMKLTRTSHVLDQYEWVCRTKKAPAHNVKRSVRSGSWFSESKLNIVKILCMTEYFVHNRSQNDIMKEFDVSNECVCNWRSFFREVCFEIVVRESGMIGGVGKIVEINERKFSKQKYYRGKHMEGKWVFSGVERGSKKCFLRVVEKKDKETLLDIIKASVLPGTTIISECWKAYDTFRDEAFNDLRVNHSLHFKNPETDAGTNVIEGVWSAIKRSLPARIVTDQFDLYVAEYLWRRNHSGDDDLMASFLEGIKKIYPPKIKDT